MTSTTFCATIKERTASAHERAESHAFIRALLSGELNVRALVLMMESLVPVYDELETCLREHSTDATVALFDHRRLDRAARLREDLHALGRREPAAVCPEARVYAAAISDAAQSPQRLLAHHYTRYLGDLAGGQAISRLVQRHYDVPPHLLSYYDFSDLGDLPHYRKQYKALLDLVPWSPTEQAEFITECQVAFDASSGLFFGLALASGMQVPACASAAGFLAAERAHSVASAARR